MILISSIRSRNHLLVSNSAKSQMIRMAMGRGAFHQQQQQPLRSFAAAARRDPPLPPLSNPVEKAIEAAGRRGDLSNLSGSGKPLSPKRGGDVAVAAGRMSPATLLFRKAEYEMRRAVRNRELVNLEGEGEKLKYKGTGIVSPRIGGDGGSGGDDSLGTYILDQSQLSSEDMKNLKP